MPRANKLSRIAQERGEALETLILRVIEQEGTLHQAAASLGVYPNTLKHWIKKNGYQFETRQVATLTKIISQDTPEPAKHNG